MVATQVASIRIDSRQITTRTVPRQKVNPLRNILRGISVLEKAHEQEVKRRDVIK